MRASGRGGSRLAALDGLRGWAALSVVAYHMLWETFGTLLPGLRSPLTGFLLDGELAIWVFFVLSGAALSASCFAAPTAEAAAASTRRLAAKRYPRLMIPILITGLMVAILQRSGLAANQAAATVVGRPDWMGLWLGEPIGLGRLLRFATLDVFTTDDPRTSVDPFLWTMRLELLGSALVFAVLLAWPHLSSPRLACLVLAATLTIMPATQGLACFLAGVLFSRLHRDGAFDRLQSSRLGVLGLLAVAAVGVLDSVLNPAAMAKPFKPLFAVVLLFGVGASPSLARAFRAPASRLLGRLSFPLYLVQFPILVGPTSLAICQAAVGGRLSAASALAIGFGSIAACLLAAWAFLPVERLTAALSEALADAILDRQASGSTKAPASP